MTIHAAIKLLIAFSEWAKPDDKVCPYELGEIAEAIDMMVEGVNVANKEIESLKQELSTVSWQLENAIQEGN